MPIAENYGKQTLKGILLSNEKMSCGHIKSPFYTLQRLKDMFCGKDESAEAWTSFTAFQFHYTISKLEWNNISTSLCF